MTVLEAWSYARPVLMTPHCNLPEGFAADGAIEVSTDPESIVRGLRGLFEMSDSQRIDMGRKGQALVVKQFSWKRIAEDMKGVYAWVLGGGPRPACVIGGAR
jgi:poly(glycerol-phosphate) alpha-glucosyltransferase